MMIIIQEHVIISMKILLNVLITIILVTSSTTPAIFIEAQHQQQYEQQYNYYYYEPNGIQSGPDYIGSSYVTSTQYYNNMIYITGITYGQYFESTAQKINEKVDEQGIEINKPMIPMGCFVSVISLPTPSLSNVQALRSSTTQQKNNNTMQFIAHQRIHDNSKNQLISSSSYKDDFCYSIYIVVASNFNNNKNPDILILGHSEEGQEENMEDNLSKNTTTRRQQQQQMIIDNSTTKRIGMILDITYDINHTNSFVLHGGKMLTSKEYQYPIMTTSFDDDEDNNVVYVVFIETDQIHNHHYHRDQQQQQQHYHLHHHINGYAIGLGQYKLTNEINTHVLLGSIKRIEPLWFTQYQWNDQQNKFISTTTTTDPIATTTNTNNSDLSWTITGAVAMRYNTNNNNETTTFENDKKLLIVVGTETNDNNNTKTITTNDGYILLLNPINGAIINSTTIRHMMNNKKNIQQQYQNTNNNQLPNYWIYGMCRNDKMNNNNSFSSSSSRQQYIYIVGSSDIKMTTMRNDNYNVNATELYSGFIMKINIDTFDIIWSRRLHAYIDMKHNNNNIDDKNKTSVYAISCAVTSNDESIWVSGIVTNNGIMIGSHLQTSYGNNDIFITRYSNNDGTIEVLHQIGTSYNDEIALYGGGIQIDQYNNAIISGNTYGNLYRKRSSNIKNGVDINADVFIMTCSYITGTIKIPFHMMKDNNNKIDIIQSFETMIWKPIHSLWKFIQSKLRYNSNHNILSRKMKVRQQKRIFSLVFMITCCIGLCLCTARSNRVKKYRRGRRLVHFEQQQQHERDDNNEQQQKTIIKTTRNDDRFGQSSRRRK